MTGSLRDVRERGTSFHNGHLKGHFQSVEYPLVPLLCSFVLNFPQKYKWGGGQNRLHLFPRPSTPLIELFGVIIIKDKRFVCFRC